MINANVRKGIVLFKSQRCMKKDQKLLGLFRDRAHEHKINILNYLALEREITKKNYLNILANKSNLVIMCDNHKILMLVPDMLIKFFRQLVSQEILIYFLDINKFLSREILFLICELFENSQNFYKQVHGKKIKEGLKKKILLGRVGGKYFGQHEQEKIIIREILNLRQQYYSLQKICDVLNTNNITSTHKKIWHPTTVKRLIEKWQDSDKNI